MSIFVHELNIQKMYTVTLLEFLNMGGGEIMLIMFVVLLLFGGKKLPELARGLGKGLRDFKDASEGLKTEINNQINQIEEAKTEATKDMTIADTDASPAAEVPAENQNTETTYENNPGPEEGYL